MPRNFVTEKGDLEILGHNMHYEMLRSREPSVFGIQGSRIFELNMWRDGTLSADYNRGWLKPPYAEDEATALAVQQLVDKLGWRKVKEKKKT